MGSHTCRLCAHGFDGRKGSGQAKFCSDSCRFWSRVRVAGADECWEWTGVLTGNGYGKISIDWKVWNAHRWAFGQFHGPIVGDWLVCHRCDNKLCQNPEHLFLGTALDNFEDMRSKGRHALQLIRAPLATDAQKTLRLACSRGHALNQENAYWKPSGALVCRPCRRADEKVKRERRAEKTAQGAPEASG